MLQTPSMSRVSIVGGAFMIGPVRGRSALFYQRQDAPPQPDCISVFYPETVYNP